MDSLKKIKTKPPTKTNSPTPLYRTNSVQKKKKKSLKTIEVKEVKEIEIKQNELPKQYFEIIKSQLTPSYSFQIKPKT